MPTITITVLICEAVIGLFIYYWLRMRMTQSLSVLNVEKMTLDFEISEKTNVHQMLSSEKEQKARQLTSYSLLAIQQHNILVQVKEEITQLSNQYAQVSDSLHADHELLFLIETIDDRSAEHWRCFIDCFNYLYPKYLTNIQMKFPTVTEKELKLAALLRLSLDSKTIANLLNLSADSIKVFRHRLRKKLQLPDEANLYNFLPHFD